MFVLLASVLFHIRLLADIKCNEAAFFCVWKTLVIANDTNTVMMLSNSGSSHFDLKKNPLQSLQSRTKLECVIPCFQDSDTSDSDTRTKKMKKLEKAEGKTSTPHQKGKPRGKKTQQKKDAKPAPANQKPTKAAAQEKKAQKKV